MCLSRSFAAGTLSLDTLVRRFVRERLAYRFVITADGTQALRLERDVREGHSQPASPISTHWRHRRSASGCERSTELEGIGREGGPSMGRLVIEARGTAAEGPVVQGVAAVGNSARSNSSSRSLTPMAYRSTAWLPPTSASRNPRRRRWFAHRDRLGGRRPAWRLSARFCPSYLPGDSVHLGVRPLHLRPRCHLWCRSGPDRLCVFIH